MKLKVERNNGEKHSLEIFDYSSNNYCIDYSFKEKGLRFLLAFSETNKIEVDSKIIYERND